jgi:hypothetical protein
VSPTVTSRTPGQLRGVMISFSGIREAPSTPIRSGSSALIEGGA